MSIPFCPKTRSREGKKREAGRWGSYRETVETPSPFVKKKPMNRKKIKKERESVRGSSHRPRRRPGTCPRSSRRPCTPQSISTPSGRSSNKPYTSRMKKEKKKQMTEDRPRQIFHLIFSVSPWLWYAASPVAFRVPNAIIIKIERLSLFFLPLTYEVREI
jgi:hypothetical protein